jgi:hypothetical protein
MNFRFKMAGNVQHTPPQSSISSAPPPSLAPFASTLAQESFDLQDSIPPVLGLRWFLHLLCLRGVTLFPRLEMGMSAELL